MRLPIQIQIDIYRKNNFGIQFLLLKRTKERGGFWQPITGGYESTDANKLEAAYRELNEETKITKENIIYKIEDFYSFEFIAENFNENGDAQIKEHVYAFEVKPDVTINIDSNEHDKYMWANYEKASNLVKYDTYKTAMKLILKKIKK